MGQMRVVEDGARVTHPHGVVTGVVVRQVGHSQASEVMTSTSTVGQVLHTLADDVRFAVVGSRGRGREEGHQEDGGDERRQHSVAQENVAFMATITVTISPTAATAQP